MVQTPIRPAAPVSAHDPIVDKNARDYIKSIQEGKPIKPRPCADFGQWEHVIGILEKKFELYKGNRDEMNGLVNSLREFNPSLDELLAPTVDEMLAQEPTEPLFPPLPQSAYLDPKVSRGACPTLDKCVDYSRIASNRAWDEFHIVCVLFGLSTVAARRVFVKIAGEPVYTNFMLIMCGPSSKKAKSWTANVMLKILKEAGLGYLIGPNDFTPQALLSSMAGKHVPIDYAKYTDDQKEYTRQKLGMAPQKGVYLDEFGEDLQEILQKNSVHAAKKKLLLTLDNCRPQHEVLTIARRSEMIDKPYLTLLGSVTYSSLRDSMKRGAKDWNNGFWGRFSFIAAPPNPEHKDYTTKIGGIPIPHEIISKLKAWHMKLGIPECRLEVEINDKGKETSDYTIVREELPETECTSYIGLGVQFDNYSNALDILTGSFSHEDFNASYTRLPITALRIAVLLASLENNNHIEIEHWAKGQEIAEIFRKNLHIMYAEVNTGNTSQKTKFETEIMDAINGLYSKGKKLVTPSDVRISSNTLKKESVVEIGKVMEGLEKINLLHLVRTPHAPKGKYGLVEEPKIK